MQKMKYNFLFVIGLMLFLGASSAVFSQTKLNKNSGILTVKTSPQSYPVKVDGQVIGMSGVNEEAVFYLTPGSHTVEVEGPGGQKFSKTINFEKGKKHCICLTVVESVKKTRCPYDIYLQGPAKYVKGDTIYFKALNRVTDGAIPVNYAWSVLSAGAKIIDGLNTDTIAVSTNDVTEGEQIRVSLDVNDGVYDEFCKQTIPTNTEAEIIKPKEPVRCDIFESGPFDEDKARFDNCVIQLQNYPDSQLYIIVYEGRGITADRLGRRTLDYLVRTRGVDPSRIQIVKAGTRPKTSVEIWIVPPGAQTPVPQ